MNQPLFKLYLFGTFSLRRKENAVSNFRGNKARALLAYLALQHGRPVLRQQLTSLLWDGYPPASAKTSLRVTLSNVRQLLAPLQLIENGRQTVQLPVDSASFWCDAVALAELLAPDNERPAAERWAEAQRLYRGELLPGCEQIDSRPFQDWLMAQRNDYRQGLEQLRAQMVALSSLPHNLPRLLTPLIGRQSEIRRLHSLLTNADYPLVTVVGEGGVGKTRLALAVAQSILDFRFGIWDFGAATDENPQSKIQNPKFSDGIWFVPLTGIVATEQVDEQIAAAVGAALHFSFYRSAALTAQLIDYVREKALLLILDGFEHLLGGADFLVTLLQEARQLKLLITSRQQLRLQAESLFPLRGLPVPDAPTDHRPAEGASTPKRTQTLPSVQLFRERARRAAANFHPNQHTYADIAAICRMVDGLPLAIELAAAQVAQRSCAEIRRALAANYATLTADLNDVPPRHRSLRLVLDDSWRLLSPEEALLLAQCTLFQGGFSTPAAAAIAGAAPGLLERLVQKSWLYSQQSERYFFHEVVRQYAGAALQAAGAEQVDATARRHSGYYLALVQTQEVVLQGETPQQATALIHQELMNIQAAWRWALTHGHWQAAGQASAALADFYQMTGLAQSGATEFALAVTASEAALAQPFPAPDPDIEWALASLLCAHAQLLLYLGSDDDALRAAQQVAVLAQPDRFPALAALALWHQGNVHTRQGRPTQARVQLEEALAMARTHAAPATLIAILGELGSLAFSEARYADAVAWYEEALAGSRTHHCSAAEVKMLSRLAAVYHALDNYAQASRSSETALQLARQIGAHDVEDALLGNLGIIWAIRGDYATARHYFNLALSAHRQSGNRLAQAYALCNLGSLLSRVGDYSGAFAYTQQGLDIMQLSGFAEELATALINLGLHAHNLGDDQAAQRYARQGLQSSQQVQNRDKENFAWKVLGHALAGLGQLAEAAAAYTRSVTLAHELALPYMTIEPLAGLVRVTQAQGGAPAVVMDAVEEILAFLSQATLSSLEDPFGVYLTCYQALTAHGDPRAEPLLQEAYQQLQTQAALISDEAMRRSFLTQVADHRTLATLAERTIHPPAPWGGCLPGALP